MDTFQELIPQIQMGLHENLLYGAVAIGGLIGIVVGIKALRKWAAGGVCMSQARLDGKTVIITGANGTLGLETAVDLAKRNARVILACRSVEKGERAAVEVRKRSGNDNVVFVQLDLASLDSVRKFSAKILEEEPRIDILINNAAIGMVLKGELGRTTEGFEMVFAINHLGHFLLTNLLLDRIKESPSGRIVNVSSRGYETVKNGFDFDNMNNDDPKRNQGFPSKAYMESKLANILFTRALSRRLHGSQVTTNALHPGLIIHGDPRKMQISWIMQILVHPVRMFTKSPEQGAQTTIYCAVAEELEGVTGKYFSDCKETKLKRFAEDDEAAEKLWRISAEMVGI